MADLQILNLKKMILCGIKPIYLVLKVLKCGLGAVFLVATPLIFKHFFKSSKKVSVFVFFRLQGWRYVRIFLFRRQAAEGNFQFLLAFLASFQKARGT